VSVGLVTLLTDFGTQDGYVGAMKGAILSRAPQTALVDLTHEIPRGDVARAAYVLAQAAPWYPHGTVHLSVIDPGVGSARRAVAVRAELREGAMHHLVAPDNGLLTRVLHAAARVEAAREIAHAFAGDAPISPVFHGRDLFGPAAAHLAAGGALAELGPALDPAELVRLVEPVSEQVGGALRAPIVHVDHFGNLVTSLRIDASPRGSVRCGDTEIPAATTYSDVPVGALVALRGSEGTLEVACRDGSAAEVLGVGRGHVIHWRPLEPDASA
jgi:S-adenosyl-L-methionine hydrolase (adenosine-forming)